MPIAPINVPLKNAIKAALNLEVAGNPDLTSTIIISTLAGLVPMGLFPPAPSPLPLIPSGVSIAQNGIKGALSLEVAGNPDLTSLQMASAIQALVPNIPPVGFSILQNAIKSALSLEVAGNPDLQAEIIANAIVGYYTSGGVI